MSVLTNELLARYGRTPVPRYTSYPPANVWGAVSHSFAIEAFGRAAGRPLSLYVHVPFCRKLCFYCGCNMLVTRSQPLVERWLAALRLEVDRVASALGRAGKVVQLHLGGGTPTYLDEDQLTRVVSLLRSRFDFSAATEASIEVHPPVTTVGQLETLARLGFTRVSMGVQDFDPLVQERVNRLQPYAQTAALVRAARKVGFESVNIDLMYGLPLQTAERFDRTLDQVITLRPDRIALFGYAHVPSLKPHQRVLDERELPTPEQRLAILVRSVARLTGAGWEPIGLDHFALPADELFRARAAGTLRRNFMGYTTCADSEVIGFGPSAISEAGGAFVQNVRDVHVWAGLLERGLLGASRGWRLSEDDARRGAQIARLFCQLEADLGDLEPPGLKELAADGLVTREGSRVKVTETGRLLLRNVAAVLDDYLGDAPSRRVHAAAV
ncbi:MAG: oxygen-independent coproporphyrinogen III oxidase [Myxococcaceae bacterium]|nr:oxygen-independent coproporphyrinogen III oxidase [Myxococcaceae bacterium]